MTPTFDSLLLNDLVKTSAVLSMFGAGVLYLFRAGGWKVFTSLRGPDDLPSDANQKLSDQFPDKLLVSALDFADSPLVIIDRRLRIQWANPAFCRLSGYSLEETLGRESDDLDLFGLQADKIQDELWQHFNCGKPWQKNISCRRKDGSIYEEELKVSPFRAESGNFRYMLLMKRDLSEQERLQQESAATSELYCQAQQFISLGRLAGRLAHEINNYLVPVIIGPELAKRHLDSTDHPVYPLLQQSQQAGYRAKELVDRVLSLACRQKLNQKLVDTRDLLVELEPELAAIVGSDIKIELTAAENLPPVLVDREKLGQALLDLTINAVEAISAGGVIRIYSETRHIQRNDFSGHVIDLSPGEYIALSVADNGCGMDAATLDKARKLFYSSKHLPAGLGLATATGIAGQHGGTLDIQSEVDKGTVATLLLPVAEKGLKSETVMTKQGPAFAGNRKTLLLVDDDDIVRAYVAACLLKKGYGILEAKDGAQALQLFGETEETIHLLLTDVSMPGMSGYELVNQLNKTAPNLPVIYMSGATHPGDGERNTDRRGEAFILKPFHHQELTELIEKTLADYRELNSESVVS